MKRKSCLVATACLNCLIFLCVPAHAWNKPGHMVSGSLAYRNLKQKAPARLASWVEILKQHEHYTLYWKPVLDALEPNRRDEALFMLAARWPDDMRDPPLSDTFHRRVWHFADHALAQPGAPANLPDGPLPNTLKPGESDETFNNLLTALPHNIELVHSGDGNVDVATKARALCWVLHLTGDLHQPLHMVSRFSASFPHGDQGGNATWIAIPPSDHPLRYHSFWDGLVLRGREDRLIDGAPAIIARGITIASRRAAVLAARPDLQRSGFPQLSATSINDWAQEGVGLGRNVGYLDGTLTGGKDEQEPFEMPDGFSSLAQNVAERQVALAGYRMSDLLAQ